MFDLEKQIAAWRKEMLAAGIKSPEPLEELEAHLRDDIEQRLNKGASAQAAFEKAVVQLGRAFVLRQEFKQNPFDIRFLSPIYMRVYCFLAAPIVLSLIWTLPETFPVSRLASTLVNLFIALYIGGLPFFYRQLFTRHERLMVLTLRVGNWFLPIWTTFALLTTVPLFNRMLSDFHHGTSYLNLGWSVLAALVGTIFAALNHAREQIKAHTHTSAASC